jgi:hypothetical protein
MFPSSLVWQMLSTSIDGGVVAAHMGQRKSDQTLGGLSQAG